MGASDIRAGKAYVELGLKDQFTKALEKAEKRLQAFGEKITSLGKGMAGIGAAIVAPLTLAATTFASMGDEVNKASQRTGVAVEELSALKYAAEQSGASFEDLEAGLRKMSKGIFEASEGSAGAQKALASLGITASMLKGMKPEDQIVTIAEALDHVEDAGAKASVAMEIFGKGGAKLLPLMEGGAKAIKELTERAKALGLTFSAEDAEAATKFGDTLDDIHKQLKAVTFQAGAAVAQALQPFADAAINCLTSVIGWVKENRNLVVAVLGVGVALVTAGAAFIGVGLAIKTALAAASGISAAFSLIGSAIGLLLNPVVLVGAGLVALGAYLVMTTETGAAALDWLSQKFETLATTVKDTVGGIADALAAGDIGLAAKILWVGIQTAFVQGSQEMQAAWIKFKALFVQVSAAAFFGALEIYQNVKASLLTAFENTTSFLGSLWDGFIGTFTSAWNTAVNFVTKGLNKLRGLFDDTFDSDAANRMADQMADSFSGDRASKELENARKREAERQQNIRDVEAQRAKAVKDLQDREQAISGGADANAQEDLAKLQANKAALEAQLQELRGKAKTEKEAKKDDGPKRLDKGKIDLDSLLQNRAAVGAVTQKSAGTFSAGAVGLLGGGQVADRIAKAAEETAKNTAKIVKQKDSVK